MKTAWLTYAWKDNEGTTQGDVDFVIQEVEKQSISVRTDKRDLVVGRALWPQIKSHITDPDLCDAWVFLITANSLASKPCREELLYALERALDKRKANFPIIGIFKGSFPPDLPKALAVRLCVSTDEPNWAHRVAGGIRSEKVSTHVADIPPYHAHLCNDGRGAGDHMFEVRPRLGSWSSFCVGVAKADVSRVVSIHYSPSTGESPNCAYGHGAGSMQSPLEDWEEGGFAWKGAASPAVSASIAAHVSLKLDGRPLKIRFGRKGGPLFDVDLEPYQPTR